MALYLCKRITFHSSQNPSILYNPQFSLSFSLILYSTLTKKQEISAVAVRDLLLHKYQFSPETVSKLPSVWNRKKKLVNPDLVLMFLKETGFSQSQLEKVVKGEPRLLSASLEKTIKPKIKNFQDLGFSAEDISEIISKNPSGLYRSMDNRIVPALLVLRSLLGSSFHVTKVLKRSGRFLNWDLEKNMIPNIEFLKSCGVGMEQIKKHIYNFPYLFMHGHEHMKNIVKKVDEMGICRSSRMFIHAVRVIASMSEESWELKLKCFSNLGFSDDAISKMFIKAPQVFAVSQRKLKEVKEALIATEKYDIS